MAEDYLLRLIQQVAQMLAGILAYRKAGQMTQAAEAIEVNCFRVAGIPLAMAKLSSAEELLNVMESGPMGLRCTRKVMLAELLIQDAELDDQPEGAFQSRSLAFALLASAMEILPSNDAASYRTKMEELAAQLRSGVSDPYVKRKLDEYDARQATLAIKGGK